MESAPVAQQTRAQEVSGVITGGQFAEIWLGMETSVPNEKVTITSTWDRNDPGSQGLGFYVLNEQQVSAVLNGAKARDENMASSSKLGPGSLDSEVGVEFLASSKNYTIVVFNNSNADANFTLVAKNAFITDDSNQVMDPNAAMATPAAGEEGAEAAADVTPDAEATEAAPEAAATATPEAEASATVTATATPAAEATAAPAPMGTPGVVRAQELRGELAEQNAQHYFGLEPSIKDGQITLVLAFDPQDSTELARRMNFWVLDQNGFNRFLSPSEDIILSNIATAAGSSHPDLAANERSANFTASGFGPYTVIVYNNSTVPATYSLKVTGGILIDDSGQTITAMQPMTGTATMTDTAAAGDAATPAVAGEAAATPAAGEKRAGEPGGTYTVQSGDSLSLIARDIYGSVGLWEGLCSYNNLADCNNIEVGDVLQLPTTEQIGSGATAPAAAATPAPAAAATPAPVTATTDVTSTTPITETGAVTETETMTETAAPETAAPTVDLVTALEAQGSFTILVDALKAAGLTDALEGPGPFTIFAPTDAAFEALSGGIMDQLMSNPTAQLTQILLFHVLPGKVLSSDITDGGQATTQQGKAVSFETAAGGVKVNGANVVLPDIVTTNGVIHAIDAVILPPP